jgi:hypothetical protein
MSVTIEHVTKAELESRLASALARVELSLEELADLADSYRLTADESEVWDEVRRIQFLLGE